MTQNGSPILTYNNICTTGTYSYDSHPSPQYPNETFKLGDKRFTEVTQLISYSNEGTASAEELLPVPYVLPTALLPGIEDRSNSNKNTTK